MKMKGGYKPVPQDNENYEPGVVHAKRTSPGRFYWKVLYLAILIVVTVMILTGLFTYHHTSSNKVLKPIYDRKHYKAITLENKLKVLLIQDEVTLLSGAGLDVQVGSMSDLEAGEEFNGLAHFTEHAMYMGSKDFPKFNELANYLQVHGGNDNAYTTQTHTNYYFYVNSASFEHSLEIFAASFRHPLFNPKMLEGEKQAIQNELEKDIPQTSWKKFSIMKLISDPDHPFQKFNVGSKEIFDSADFISKIRWFYDKYYSSSLMTLVILSNLPLFEQETIVRKYFSDLPLKEVSKPTYYQNPYPQGTKYINQYVIYENGATFQELELVFPISWSEQEMSTDHQVISAILGDESHGTVTSHLRDLGFIIDLTVSTLTFAESFSCLTIRVHLTSLGCCKVKDIVKVVFDYLDIISHKIDRSVWQDDYNLRKIKFSYHDETDIKTLLKTVPGWMSSSEPRYYLNSQLNSKYSKADIDLVLSRLVPSNLNIIQGGNGFDTMQCEIPPLNQFDDRFISKYSATQIPKSWIQYWSSKEGRVKGLAMPPRNVFIPEDFDILPTSRLPQPIITLDEDGFKSYWAQDSSLPKSYVNCKFYIPGISESAKDMSLLRLYLGLVSESLDTIAYAASSVQYRYFLGPVHEGFRLKLEGFSDKDKFYKFLKLVVGALNNPRLITDLRYKYQVQEMSYDGLNKIYNDQPFRQGFYLARLLFAVNSYDNRVLTNLLSSATQQEVVEFGKRVLHKLALKCFTYGNHNVKQSLTYVKFIRDHFLSYVMSSSYAYSGTVVSLPSGRWLWPIKALNPTETNNCIFVMNQISTATTSGPSLRNHVILTMLGTIMKDPAYATLRTKGHLGYTVFTGSLRMMNVDFFYLLLQGSHYKPDYMLGKVVGFMEQYRVQLEHIVNNGTDEYESGDEWFEATKSEAIGQILSIPKSQIGSSDFYSAISQSAWPFFNKGDYILSAAGSIQKEDILEFYDNYIIGKARQLIIQIHGSGYEIENTSSISHAGIIENMQEFKSKLGELNVDFTW